MATADEALADGTTRRKIPAAPPSVQPVSQARAPVSPMAADINQQMRRPGGLSPAASALNQQVTAARTEQATAQAAARAAAPVAQPAYRTGAAPGQPQFQQTPAPVNPNPRAATALGAGTPSAPVAAARPAAATRPAANPRTAGANRATAALGVGLEAVNTAAALSNEGPAAAVQAAKEGGVRLAAGAAGAQIGGRVGGPIGATLGGTAGYLAGNALADTELVQQDALTDAFAARREEELRGAGVMQGGAAMSMVDSTASMARRGAERDVRAGKPLFNPTVEELGAIGALRQPGAATGPAATALAPTPAATPAAGQRRANFVDETGAAPPAGGTGGEVVGTFNGRQITRSEANDLAGSLNGGTGNGLENGNPTGVGTASTALASGTRSAGPISRAVGASIGGTSDLSGFAEQLDKQIADLGPLNMRSKRQLVGELLGLKGRALGQEAGEDAAGQRQAQELEARAAGDALRADVDREQIAASDRTQRRQNTQTITGEDGTIYRVEGSTLTPLQADGKNVRAPRTAAQTDNTQAKIAAELLGNFVPYGATPEQIQQGVIQANQAAAALTAGTTAAPAAAAPQGYTLVGTSNGKPVYRDAAGKQFIDE